MIPLSEINDAMKIEMPNLNYLLLIFILVISACKMPESKNDKLFNEFYEVFPEASLSRPNMETMDAERQSFLFYLNGHMDKAAEAFQNLYNDFQLPRHLFYSAVANLDIGNTSLAVSQFEELEQNNNLSMKYPLPYYQGLAYIKMGELEKAKVCLKNTKPNFQYYKGKADELLTRI